MIKSIRLSNFKCFSDIKFEMENVNLLAGSNGCGKTSLVHALLLIRQSIEQNRSMDQLYLYGKYVDLGMAKDILYEYAKNDKIEIELENELNQKIAFTPSYEADKYILKSNCLCSPQMIELDKFGLLNCPFEYISAERIVPQNTFSAISFDTSLGKRGENTLSFLEENGLKMQVDPALCAEGSDQNNLLYQVDEWLNKLFDGFKLNMAMLTEADAVSMRFQEHSENWMSAPHRAINVGFGITYVLPVLVALLKAKRDDITIIENPEAHLHPKAQRMIGELILRSASTGAQIILETHSDHILNGIRLGIKNGVIKDPELVTTFFFTRENIGKEYHFNVYKPQIDKDGNINIWPDGFFDEWDKALTDLF